MYHCKSPVSSAVVRIVVVIDFLELHLANGKRKTVKRLSKRDSFAYLTLTLALTLPPVPWSLRFDVLIQAEEIIRVVLLLDGSEPVKIGTKCRFDRVFLLVT
jgi:hypothetical protein